jgi:hypothetical protein
MKTNINKLFYSIDRNKVNRVHFLVIAREMYRLAVEENLGYKAIADKLTSEGHQAHGGRPFAAYTIERILNNPALTGILVYGRKPRKGNPKMNLVEIHNFFPAILSEEE